MLDIILNKIINFSIITLKKIFPYIFAINALFIWGLIFIFFYMKSNNFLGYILAIISIGVSVYSHEIAIKHLEKKYINKDDQN